MKKIIYGGLFLLFCLSLTGCGGGGGGTTPSPSPSPSASIPPDSIVLSPLSGNNSTQIQTAINSASAGSVIYLHGGIYSCLTRINLNKSGADGNPIKLWAYPGETPVLDFTGEPAGTHGIYITRNYWHLKGIELKKAGAAGIRITGNYNTIEQCITHQNNDSGIWIGISKGTAVNVDGSQAAYNQVINCDSYLNYDPYGSTGDGGNADGFACKLNAGRGNLFRGCRAWENSDDGWDLYLMNFQVVIENCWTWHNGDPNSFVRPDPGAVWAGNGQGFKLGGGTTAQVDQYYSHGPHILRNCIAFDTKYGNSNVRAFDRNNSMTGITMINCIAWDSQTGFYFSLGPDDGTSHLLRNCVAFSCTSSNANLTASGVTQDHNSWNAALGVTANSADFAGLDVNLAKAPRQPDGSLPNNGFARLVAGSDLINKGIDVGLPYSGAYPDLGAFEYGM